MHAGDAPHQPDPPHKADTHVESGTHGGHEAHEANRLALIIALSIAVVSVLGAIVGWRAETHASLASRYDQDAVAATIAGAQDKSRADSQARAAQSNYTHYQRLGEEAERLQGSPCPVTDSSSVTSLDAQAACSMQQVFAGYNDPAYVKDGRFDLARYSTDVQKVLAYNSDSDAGRYEVLAEDQRSHEDNLLGLSVGLVLALALLTMARLNKTVVTRLVLAIPGWLALVGGAGLLAVLEL
jgi:hypothetical protein